MKKKYSVSRLVSGAFFTADAFSEGDIVFAFANIPIKEKDIAELKQWGITEVWSDGQLKVPRGNVDLQLSPASQVLPADNSSKKESENLIQSYNKLVDSLNVVMKKISENIVETKLVDTLVKELLNLVDKNETALVSLVLSNTAAATYNLAKAGINCAILSTVIGKTMELSAQHIIYLATGALLHDVGMVHIPEAILNKNGKLTGEEVQKIKAHPLLSYKIITNDLHYPDEVGNIGLQHHERWDGDGYPRKLNRTETSFLARIVSVTDALEAMISKKPYRNPLIGYSAMKSLLSDNSRRFDPDVIKALVSSMGIYPIGSIVILNNAVIAKVVEIHSEAPLRPKLLTLVDALGKSYNDNSGPILDLLTEKTLFIARAVSHDELLEPAL